MFIILCTHIIFTSIVQAADRALIVDTLPSHKQENANAWATRMIGIGSCIGYFVLVLKSFIIILKH